MLMRGKLLGGALFAGALFGATVADVVAPAIGGGGGYSSAQRTIRHLQAEPVHALEARIVSELHDEDDMMLHLIIAAVTQEIL